MAGYILGAQSRQVDAQGVAARATFFRTQVSIAQLRLDRARVVDLAKLRSLRKLCGHGLPGFRSGWDRRRNRRKAFVATAGQPPAAVAAQQCRARPAA